MFDCFFLCWGWFQDKSVHVFLVDYFGLIILLGKRERFHVDNLLLFCGLLFLLFSFGVSYFARVFSLLML